MSSIKLVVVTANDLVRHGIQMLVQATPSIEMVQALPTVHDCEQYLQQHRVQVLLLDDALPSHLAPHRVLVTLLAACSPPRILILSDYLSECYVQRLLEMGAAGFIYKDDHLEDTLVAGIKLVVAGYHYLSPQASALPYGRLDTGDLNRTDLEVLQLIARGYTVQEISDRVGLVDRSVYRIRGKLRQYLDVRTNEQLVEAAQRRGLLKT